VHRHPQDLHLHAGDVDGLQRSARAALDVNGADEIFA
jgi:hypothetical protein